MVEINTGGNPAIAQGLVEQLKEELNKAAISRKPFFVIIKKSDEPGFLNAAQGNAIHLFSYIETGLIDLFRKVEAINNKAVSDALYKSFVQKLSYDYNKMPR